MVELVINQFGLRFGLPLGFGWDFQQRIGFGVVAVRLGGFVFPLYAYSFGRLKLRQRFERTGFEQVMGVLSVCAFDGKGVFLPVVDGGFSVADFGGTPAQGVVTVFGAAITVFYVAVFAPAAVVDLLQDSAHGVVLCLLADMFAKGTFGFAV